MKVRIKNLHPNPFRDIENYPIDTTKVGQLIASIKQTGYWGNILARVCDGEIQIAYGHHRLEALRKLYGGDSDVKVAINIKPISDADMVRIMANENVEKWGASVVVIHETVRVTRDFLMGHPEMVEEIECRSEISEREPSGARVPKYEVSAKIISTFLGSKLWYEQKVSEALKQLGLIEDGAIDKDALETMPSAYAAKTFVKEVIEAELPVEEQKIAAKQIAESENFGKESIKAAIAGEPCPQRKRKLKEDAGLKEFVGFIKECTSLMNDLSLKFMELSTLKGNEAFDFTQYEGTSEANTFENGLNILINNIKTLKGANNVEEKESKKESKLLSDVN